MLQKFDIFHSFVKFTPELEFEDRIHFLNLSRVRKEDGFIQLDLYKKKIRITLSNDFRSFAPVKQKTNFIKCFVSTVKEICPSEVLMLIFISSQINGVPGLSIQKRKDDPDDKPEVWKAKEITYSIFFFQG